MFLAISGDMTDDLVGYSMKLSSNTVLEKMKIYESYGSNCMIYNIFVNWIRFEFIQFYN